MSAILPRGFRSSGIHCGIKSDPARQDLALFVSDRDAVAAGVFTQNQVCGAPVRVSRGRVPADHVRAVVINSGNANAATGQRGIDDARWMTSQIAEKLHCDADAVLVCSTGVIGHHLPRTPLETGLPQVVVELSASDSGLESAARAMMTTDTVPKYKAEEVSLSSGATVRVCGVAKGAAMIAPNMATMLAVVLTDAALTGEAADQMLRAAVDRSFNSISVEGHTSTSDSVILLANGCASDEPAAGDDLESVSQAVEAVCCHLAQAIIRDAEGAAHFVTIEANGFATQEDAREICRTVAEDALVKTAVTGNDPNWGRIVSCCGRTSVRLTETDLSLQINGVEIYGAGQPLDYDADDVAAKMATGDVLFRIEATLGEASARFWTSDLTQEYVRLNSEYTT